MPAIPKYEGTRCYQHLCTQYCVIYNDNKQELDRREFLAESGKDPRQQFIEHLLSDTAGTGSIIVYNEDFEKKRLEELAELFPQYKEQIKQRIDRIKDLMIPFKKRDYYHPSFKKQYSIKVVLPVLCPEHESSYKNLSINNGSLAMSKYEMLERMGPKEKLETKIALKDYCYMDVLAMVKIVEALERMVAKTKVT